MEFQKWEQRKKTNDPSWHMHSFHDHARQYINFFQFPNNSREGVFFWRLRIMEVSTLYPFLIGLYHRMEKNHKFAKDKLGILQDLESFLVRRMVCKLTAKNYNNLFLDLLSYLEKKKDFRRKTVQDYLLEKESDIDRWPDDEEFKKFWLGKPIYKNIRRPRLRMILKALDESMQDRKTELYELLEDNLTVEHVMPIAWKEHWSLPKLSKDESPEKTVKRMENRDHILHTIGNLTFLTGTLNPSVSNGPYKKKRTEILRHTMINLNKFLHDSKTWDEKEIIKRGRKLFNKAQNIWPHPG